LVTGIISNLRGHSVVVND